MLSTPTEVDIDHGAPPHHGSPPPHVSPATHLPATDLLPHASPATPPLCTVAMLAQQKLTDIDHAAPRMALLCGPNLLWPNGS